MRMMERRRLRRLICLCLFGILCLLVPVVDSSHSDGGETIPHTEDDTVRTKTLVQCQMDASLDESVVFNTLSGEYKSISNGTPPPLADDERFVTLRECWCARVLNRPKEYCSPNFDTCQVQGSHGPIFCFKNQTKINVVRGIWPFCLFWILSLLYMWVASEPGRRARGFLKRHLYNFLNDRRRQRRRRNGSTDDQQQQQSHVVARISASSNQDEQEETRQLAVSNGTDDNRNSALPSVVAGGNETVPDIEATPTGNAESPTRGQEQQTNAQRDSFPINTPIAASPPLSEEVADRATNSSNSSLRPQQQQPSILSAAQPQQEPQTERAGDDSHNEMVEVEVNSLVDDATHATRQSLENNNNDDDARTLAFPPEFRSRSNYLQLLQELCHMYRYEPDRMAQLWHTAWVHERRRELRQLARLEAALEGAQQNNDSNDNVIENGNRRTASFWGRRTSAANNSASVERAVTSAPRTIQLSLKTKRFEADNEEKEKDRGNGNTDDDDGDEGKREDSTNQISTPHNHRNERKHSTTCAPQHDDEADDDDEDERGRSCVICFVEFEHGDVVGDIPCQHMFHKECLKTWLQRSNRCPLCQNEGIATLRHAENVTTAPTTTQQGR